MMSEQDREQARGHPQNAVHSCNCSFLQKFCRGDVLFDMIFTFACLFISDYFCPFFPRGVWGLFATFPAVVAVVVVRTYENCKLKFPSDRGSKKHRLHRMAVVVAILVYRTAVFLLFCTLPQFNVSTDLGRLGGSLMFKQQNSSDLEQSNDFIGIIMRLFCWFFLVSQMSSLLTELNVFNDQLDSSSAYDGSRSSSSSRQALGTLLWLNGLAGLLLLWHISPSGSVNSGYGRLGRSLMSKQQKGSGSDESNNFIGSLIGVFVCFAHTVHIILALWTELNYLFDSSSADNGSSNGTQQQALVLAGDTGSGSSFLITDLFPSYSLSTSGAGAGAGALVFTQPPETDDGNGGVLNPADQINHVDVRASSSTNHDLGNVLVFTPLEEEKEECLWEQIPEYMTTAESDSAMKQVHIMPTPSLQTDLQTNKNITTPPSSSCSRQTYWPRVHQDIMSTISESTTQHINLVQKCSQEEEMDPSMNEKHDLSFQGLQIPRLTSSPLHYETFLNEGENSIEIALTNSRGTNVSANKNFYASAHLEKEHTKAREITSQDLQKVIGMKRSVAAETLGVSVSTFKRIRKESGISKWPDYRNEKKCSLLKKKLLADSIQRTKGCATSTHSGCVGSNHKNSTHSEQAGEKMMSLPCRTPSTSGHAKNQKSSNDSRNLCFLAEAAMCQEAPESSLAIPTCLDLNREQAMDTLSPIMPHVTGVQDVRTWTIKATYGKCNLRFLLSSTKITELKEKVAKRLQLELDSFDMQYEDDEKELVLIACDEDLEYCLKLFSEHQKIRLLVVDR